MGTVFVQDEDELVAVVGGLVMSLPKRFDEALSPREIMRGTGAVSDAIVGSEGQLFVGSGDGKLVSVVDNEQQLVAGFGNAVTSLVEDGESLLVALSDGRLLRVKKTPMDFGWVPQNPKPINNELMLEKRGLLLTFDEDGWMRVFDRVSGKVQTEMRVSRSAIWSVASDAEESVVACIGDDQILRCFEIPECELRFEKKVQWGVRDVCIAPDGTWLAAAPAVELGHRREGAIGIWNLVSGKCERTLDGHQNWVLKLAAADNRTLVSTCENRTTRVWDVDTNQEAVRIAPEGQSPVEHIAFMPEKNAVLLGHRDGWITGWNVESGKQVAAWAAFGDAITGLVVSGNQRVIATSRSSSEIRVFQLQANRPVARFDLGRGYLQRFGLSRDKRWVAFTGQSRDVAVYPLDAE